MSKKKEVIKHKGAIAIENKISFLERKVWNVLLANAYYDLPNKSVFDIPLNDLAKSLEFDSNNLDYLKKALRKLGDTKVEWNILNSNGKEEEWGFVNLLSYASIKKGICTYEYSQFLRDRLYQPALYARINLLMQNKFSGKYTLALYELLTHYIDSSKSERAVTEFFSIDKYRVFIGANDNEYKKFCDLKRRTITEPVGHINKVSNIRVNTEYKKEGQVTTAVRFFIEKNNEVKVPELVETNVLDIIPVTLESELQIDNEILKIFFVKQNISFKTIISLKKQIVEKDIVPEHLQEEYFLYLKDYCEKQPDIKSISGLFINLLKTGQQSENFLFKIIKEVEKKEAAELKFKNIFNSKLKFIYENSEFRHIQNYFLKNESIFFEILEKKRDNIMIIIAIKSNQGKENFDLVRNNSVIRTLAEDVKKLPDYSFTDFDSWKHTFESIPENKSVIEKLLKESKKESNQ